MVDILITIVLWIVGFYAFFILGMALLFAIGGAVQTGKSELKVISIFALILMVFLVWIGISSFSSDVEKNTPVSKVDVSSISSHDKPLEKPKVSSNVEEDTPILKDDFETYEEIILWVFYAIFFTAFFLWLFAPSENKGEGRDLVKKKFKASVKLEKDEAGRKPWDPEWRPKE